MEFQALVLLLFGLKLTSVSVQYPLTNTSWHQTVSITCVTLLLHFSKVRNVFVLSVLCGGPKKYPRTFI